MKASDHAQKPCPVARTVGQIGDPWTLLIVRNALLGTRKFEDFCRQLGVTRHVLAQRLRDLVAAGIFKQVPSRPGSPRMEYRLTRKGYDLQPVILALVNWGNTWMFEGETLPLEYRHADCGAVMRPTVCCSECGEELTAFNTQLAMGDPVQDIAHRCAQPDTAEQLGYPVNNLTTVLNDDGGRRK